MLHPKYDRKCKEHIGVISTSKRPLHYRTKSGTRYLVSVTLWYWLIDRLILGGKKNEELFHCPFFNNYYLFRRIWRTDCCDHDFDDGDSFLFCLLPQQQQLRHHESWPWCPTSSIPTSYLVQNSSIPASGMTTAQSNGIRSHNARDRTEPNRSDRDGG